jgi:hypothetical protein
MFVGFNNLYKPFGATGSSHPNPSNSGLGPIRLIKCYERHFSGGGKSCMLPQVLCMVASMEEKSHA